MFKTVKTIYRYPQELDCNLFKWLFWPGLGLFVTIMFCFWTIVHLVVSIRFIGWKNNLKYLQHTSFRLRCKRRSWVFSGWLLTGIMYLPICILYIVDNHCFNCKCIRGMPEFFCEFWENKNVKTQKVPFILWNKKSNNIVYSQQ